MLLQGILLYVQRTQGDSHTSFEMTSTTYCFLGVFLKVTSFSSMTTNRTQTTRTTRTKQKSLSARAGPKWSVRLPCVRATVLEAVYRMLSY